VQCVPQEVCWALQPQVPHSASHRRTAVLVPVPWVREDIPTAGAPEAPHAVMHPRRWGCQGCGHCGGFGPADQPSARPSGQEGQKRHESGRRGTRSSVPKLPRVRRQYMSDLGQFNFFCNFLNWRGAEAGVFALGDASSALLKCPVSTHGGVVAISC
jgi:hypothetical protein